MTYDHWKTTSPEAEQLGPEPEDQDMPTTANNGIDHTMAVCAGAIAKVFEECACRYEEAIAAEEELHRALIGQLRAAAADCRQQGEAARKWLTERGKTANGLLAKAEEAGAALGPLDFKEEVDEGPLGADDRIASNYIREKLEESRLLRGSDRE